MVQLVEAGAKGVMRATSGPVTLRCSFYHAILPKDDAAAKELKKRTLTNLYNARPAWLDHAHKALDEAVAEAYGWGDDWRAGLLTEDEILSRLFKLNQESAAAEAKAIAKKPSKSKAKANSE